MEQDLGVIPLLALTQHGSLQDLQLVFARPNRYRLLKRKGPLSWRPRDTEHTFPALENLKSLSLSNINLWNMSPELVGKLNLNNLRDLRVDDCPGSCDLIDRIADSPQLTLKLKTLELELHDGWSKANSCAALKTILGQFKTLEDFRLSFSWTEERIDVEPDLVGQ